MSCWGTLPLPRATYSTRAPQATCAQPGRASPTPVRTPAFRRRPLRGAWLAFPLLSELLSPGAFALCRLGSEGGRPCRGGLSCTPASEPRGQQAARPPRGRPKVSPDVAQGPGG